MYFIGLKIEQCTFENVQNAFIQVKARSGL